jgi:hypothetical protein
MTSQIIPAGRRRPPILAGILLALGATAVILGATDDPASAEPVLPAPLPALLTPLTLPPVPVASPAPLPSPVPTPPDLPSGGLDPAPSASPDGSPTSTAPPVSARTSPTHRPPRGHAATTAHRRASGRHRTAPVQKRCAAVAGFWAAPIQPARPDGPRWVLDPKSPTCTTSSAGNDAPAATIGSLIVLPTPQPGAAAPAYDNRPPGRAVERGPPPPKILPDQCGSA